MGNPVLTYNGMSIKEMVEAINTVMSETGKSIKVDRGKDCRPDERYFHIINPLVFVRDTERDGLFDGTPELPGGDIEAVYRQLCDEKTWRQSDRVLYVRVATAQEWREHNARWERAMVDDPHRYGYVPLEEALRLSGKASWDELVQALSSLPDGPNSHASLGAIGSDGQKHIIVSASWLREL